MILAEASMVDGAGRGGVPGGRIGGAGSVLPFRGFASFLAAHAVSVSSPDHVKSDVIFVAMELLDCCLAVAADQSRGLLQVHSEDLMYLNAVRMYDDDFTLFLPCKTEKRLPDTYLSARISTSTCGISFVELLVSQVLDVKIG